MTPTTPLTAATGLTVLSDPSSLLAVSTLELSLRMGVALAIIITLITAATTITKKRGNRAHTSHLKILQQQQLTKHTTLTLLTAGQQQLLIATNNQDTTLLAQGPTLTTPPNTGLHTNTDIDIRPTNKPIPNANRATNPAHATNRAPSSTSQPKTRARANPVKQLQNRTVRRA